MKYLIHWNNTRTINVALVHILRVDATWINFVENLMIACTPSLKFKDAINVIVPINFNMIIKYSLIIDYGQTVILSAKHQTDHDAI